MCKSCMALKVEEGKGDIRGSVDRLGDTERGGHSGSQDVRCPCATKKVRLTDKREAGEAASLQRETDHRKDE